MASDVTSFILALAIVVSLIAVGILYGRRQCPPCRKIKCSVPLPEEVRMPMLQDVLFVRSPPAGTPAPVAEALVGGPSRTYISSNDTRWHEIGFVKGEEHREPFRLFAHRKYPRSDRYEYFMRTKDGINVPFNTEKDVELQNGDLITVPGFSGQFKAVIYPVEKLVYNPVV
jgi:hypothetical protein